MNATVLRWLKRLGGVILTLFIASILIFSMVSLTPGDPAAMLAGGSNPNPETLAAVREQLRLNDPIPVQYLGWLGDLFTGDLGRSFRVVKGDDVGSLIAPRLVTTGLLVAYAALLIVIFGIGSGLLAGTSGKAVDRVVTILTSAAMGAPTFVVAVALIAIFAVNLGWFPTLGAGEDGLADRIHHLTLPAISLAMAYLAFISRITRTSVLSQAHADHVETATVRGLPRNYVVRHHIWRNASGPILSVSGLSIAGLFAGTAVAEQAFGINGIGSLLTQAAASQDLPVVQILSRFMVATFVIVNLIVDEVSAMLDPRLKQEVSA
ncbi:MAG: ABC transporter permease [Galactobacter sp.]